MFSNAAVRVSYSPLSARLSFASVQTAEADVLGRFSRAVMLTHDPFETKFEPYGRNGAGV